MENPKSIKPQLKLGDIVVWNKDPERTYQIVGLSNFPDRFLVFDTSKGEFNEKMPLSTAKETDLSKVKK